MPKLPAALERSAILQAIRSADQAPQIVEYDRYVTDHIRRTGRAVQATEIAFALMGLAVGWLCFLLAAAVAEHWLTERGFSDGFRYFLFAVAVLATGWYAKVLLWPLVTGRINPLYTAKAIEESAPTLKNSLINLLTLRGSGRQLPPAVLATLEQHAAEGISRAPEEAVVDRSRVVRMAAVMVGLLAAVALYALISTKDPFTTAARIVAPWAKIAPPSRVRISDVTPGDVTLVEGQTLEIEARVDGLGEGEQVDVVLTSADGQRVDDRQRLAFDDDLNRFTLSLPTLAEPGQRAGLSGRVRYRVEAGDGRTPTYVLNVLPAPAIVVSAVDYNFPAYTGLLDYTQEKSGELRAIEGSRVTLHAQANTELESAYVDFDADGSRDLPMQVDGATATASFDLALRPDRQTPKHGSYVLRLKTAAGLANAKPAKHAIEVYPDYPPEAALTFPEEPELTIRQNDTIAIRGTARDPDFALSDVRVFAERDGRRVLHKRLLTRSFQGKYNAEFAFTPTDHGLRAGDVVEYWLEASDNRQPEPQTVVTGRQTFRIASPNARDDRRPDELADAGENGESGEGGPDQGQQGDKGDAGEQAGGGDQGESGQSPDGQNGQGQEGQDSQQQDQSQQGDNGDSQPGQQQELDGGGQESQNQQGQGEPDQQQRESNDAGQRGSQQQPQDESGDEQQEQQDQQSGEGGQGLQTQDQGADSNSEEPLQGQQGESQDSPDQNNGQSSGGQKGSPNDSGQQNSQQGGGGNESGKQTGSRIKPGDDGAGNGDGSPTPQEQPIDDSGAEDGEAFERMLDHMEQNGDQGQNSGRQPREAAPQDHPTDSGESVDQSDGAGADTMGGDLNNKPQERPQDGGESGESPGGKQQSPRGDQSTPGAAGEPQGSPTTENDRTPTEESRDQPAPNEGDSEEAQSPASDRNKTEMDEQGDQGGEKSGAGAEGGGQRADQQGSGSDGQNQASDEGGGRAQEQWQGDPGSQAGADQQSDTQTGESGRDTGEGSTERPGQGDKPGGQQSDPQGGESQDASESGSQSDQSSSRPDNQQQPQPNENQQPPPSDASQPGQGAPGQSQQEGADGEQSDAGSSGGASAGPTAGGDVGGDKANLDYARQKTDLVLEKLSDQLKEGEVDPELLDKLGWNEDQLRRFVERWNQRKQAARRAPNSKAEAELDAALRGLGRLPGSPAGKTSRTIDELRNNAGARNAPAPLKWRERLQRYNQGVSGAGD